MSQEDFDIMGFSSQLEIELNQLITLAWLVRQMNDPAESREGFFAGLADMIECSSDRIKEIIEPIYDHCHKMRVAQDATPALVKGKGAV